MGFISSDIISEIRTRVDIVQIVSEHVHLKPLGNSYKALCPFHKEKTPSFNVVPDKQIFHCFGCGKGGDVFTFLMEAENLSFPEAVRFLAGRAGVIINEGKQESDRSGVYEILEAVSSYYRACLKDSVQGKIARDYLRNRGISDELVEHFMIGFAPDAWQSVVERFGKSNSDLQMLERAGLIRKKQNQSGYYDVFRGRLMIPVTDIHGRVSAFGARALSPENEPKYLNSAETETFNKRKMLYNLNGAMPQIRRHNSVIVVEGYLDAISLHGHGIKNVVATLGTAISSEHIALLARNCETVYFCYDADEAGQKATLRAVSMQKDTSLTARVIKFNEPGDDPDIFVRREGCQQFKKLLEKADDIYTFLIERHTDGLKPPIEISVKENLIKKFRELVPEIHSHIARSEVIKKISKLLDMNTELLEREFDLAKKSQRAKVDNSRNSVVPSLDAVIQRQEWILKHILEYPQDIEKVSRLLTPADFSDHRLRAIYEAISFQQEAAGGELKPAEILTSLEDAQLVSRLSELIITLEDRPSEPFLECVKGLVKNRFENELKSVHQRIIKAESSGDNDSVSKLVNEQSDLRRKMDLLY